MQHGSTVGRCAALRDVQRISIGFLHLSAHHMGASFPLHAAAGFLLHMFSLPQLEAVKGSLICMLCAGRIDVCKFLALCTLAGPQ